MTILHTIQQGNVGGAETHVLDLIKHLDSSSIRSVVVSFSEGKMVDELNKLGVKCYVLPAGGLMDLKTWRKLKKIANLEYAEIIHAHGTKAAAKSFPTAGSLGIPFIYTIHGWSFHSHQSKITRHLKTQIERFLVHRAQINIAVSESNLNKGLTKLNMPRARMISNGVNIQKFNPQHKSVLHRETLGIPKDRTLIGFVNHLTPQKDPLTLIRAFAKSLEMTLDLHLLMVGDGPLKEDCIREVQKLKIHDSVTFQPFRADVTDILKIIDVYCLPSLWEGLPIGLLEAMAMKKAVIATPVDGTIEIVADQVDGLLAEVGNIDSWTKAILEMHTKPAMRMELGDRARMVAASHHDIKISVRKLERVYEEVLLHPLIPKVFSDIQTINRA